MDEFLKIVIDRFDAAELVDFLNIPTEEIVDAFSDKIMDSAAELEEFIKYGR